MIATSPDDIVTNWNGGGLHYSEDYGFGSVDAYNAVRMAEAWLLFGGPQTSANETSYTSSATNVALDDLKTTDIQFHFDGTSFDVESVNISLNITHGSSSEELYFEIDWAGFLTPVVFPAYLTDLDITLISPDGTETTLVDFNRDTAADNPADYGTDQWKSDFLANAFRGEDGIGTWTLRINDPWTGDSGTVNSATVTLHGRDGDQVNLDDDVYHYTNEVFTTLARDATRKTLADGNGGSDWLDMSAMSGNLVVSLGARRRLESQWQQLPHHRRRARTLRTRSPATATTPSPVTGSATSSTACAATTSSTVAAATTRSPAAPATIT